MRGELIYQHVPAQHAGDFKETSVRIEETERCKQEPDAKRGRPDDHSRWNCRYGEDDPFENTRSGNQTQVIKVILDFAIRLFERH